MDINLVPVFDDDGASGGNPYRSKENLQNACDGEQNSRPSCCQGDSAIYATFWKPAHSVQHDYSQLPPSSPVIASPLPFISTLPPFAWPVSCCSAIAICYRYLFSDLWPDYLLCVCLCFPAICFLPTFCLQPFAFSQLVC